MEKVTNKVSNSLSSSDPSNDLSFCGILKNGTSDLIQKLESEMPSLFQEYSDLYTRYLHSIHDYYASCNIVEHQFFEKLAIKPETLKMFDIFFKSYTNLLESHFDMTSNILRSYVQFRLSIIDSLDHVSHSWINFWSKSFSQYSPNGYSK